jgi:Leucine-rich repeat (LRR) protein
MAVTIQIMEKLFCAILVIHVIFITLSTSQNDDPPYESNKNICDICRCRGSAAQKSEYFILDCGHKDLKHLFSGWPEIFGSNLSDHELVYTMSGNPLKHLQQLPETQAITLFNCRNCSLTEITTAAFIDVPFIYRVDLAYNKLTGDSLMAEIFRGRFDNNEYEPIALNDLDLSNNQLTFLRANVFEHCPHIKRLSLSENSFKSLSGNTFKAISSLKQLEVLNLSYTELQELPDDLFLQTKNIRELMLQGNNLKTVPNSLSHLGRTLKYLNIAQNPIKELGPDSFKSLSQLTHLTIEQMPELTEIDRETLKPLQSLEVLLCKDNPKLTSFDLDAIGEHKKITYFRCKSLWFKIFNININI